MLMSWTSMIFFVISSLILVTVNSEDPVCSKESCVYSEADDTQVDATLSMLQMAASEKRTRPSQESSEKLSHTHNTDDGCKGKTGLEKKAANKHEHGVKSVHHQPETSLKKKDALLAIKADPEETATNATEAAAKTEGEASEGSSAEASEGSSAEASEGSSHEASEGSSAEASEGSSAEASEGSSAEASEGSSHEASEGSSHEASEGSSSAASEGSSHEASEGSSSAASEGSSASSSSGSSAGSSAYGSSADHGSGSGGHDHHDDFEGGLGYSLCLFGTVAFNMSLLYLINHHDPGIVLATWQVLSVTLSIFIAVLGYNTIRAVLGDELKQSPGQLMISSLSLFVVIYIASEMILYKLKSKEWLEWLHSGSALLAHMLGFAASHAFADVQCANVFGETILGDFLVVIVACVVQVIMAAIAKQVHVYIEHLHEADREHLEDLEWEKETEMMENEAMALAMGFLIVQAICFSIRHNHASAHADHRPEGVNQKMCNIILSCAGLFCILIIFGVYLITMEMKSAGYQEEDTLHFEHATATTDIAWHIRFSVIGLNSMSVAMAWCFLFYGEWQLYALGYDGPRTAACMLVGLGLTLFAFAAIFVLEEIAHHVHTSGMEDPDKVVRTMTLAIGIVIGFAWERAFHAGIADISHTLTDTLEEYAISGEMFSHMMAVLMIIIVTPAWSWFVYPMVEKCEEHAHGKYAESDRHDKNKPAAITES